MMKDSSRIFFDGLLSKLSRLTTTGMYIPEVDGLRFLAILWVVLFHIQYYVFLSGNTVFSNIPRDNLLGKIIIVGDMGVELFFVISGFILALPFAKQYLCSERNVSIKNYYWRRLTRLEPPYIIAMLTFYGLAILQGKHDISLLLNHGLASLFYLHGFIYNTRSLINSVAWSLEIEVQFYLLAPLVARIFLFNNWGRRLILGSMILLFPIFSTHFGWSSLSILGHAQFFLTGFLLADFYVNRESILPIRNWFFEIMGFAALFLLPVFWHYLKLHILVPWLILIFYWCVLTGNLLRRFFASAWVRTIGGMCYSIYLLHNPIISFFGRFSTKILVTTDYLPNMLAQTLMIVPVIALASILFFILIEKPCMNKDWPNLFVNNIRLKILKFQVNTLSK